jgi:hypothetical protein
MQDDSPLRNLLLQAWPGIAALLVAAWGVLLTGPRLNSPRPTGVPTGPAKAVAADGTIPARLWQDPLGAALSAAPPDEAAQPLEQACSSLVKDAGRRREPARPLLFLLVWVDPQNNPQTVETRRRERYATLAALSTAGYVPSRADRIAYVKVAAGRARGGKGGDGLLIPYEWFRPLEDSGRLGQPAAEYDGACVLWLGEDPDPKGKLESLIRLKKALAGAAGDPNPPAAGPHFAITGRLDSSQLDQILEGDKALGENKEALGGAWLYVTQSTAPFVREKMASFRSNSGLSLECVIGTDKQLADALAHELRSRGVDPGKGDSLALVAEWDTEYGRSMSPVFQATLLGTAAAGPETHVHHYSYLRGLDGKLPGGPPEAEDGGGDAGGGPKDRAVPSSKEGEGDPQLDYLRRLVGFMKSHHQRYKAIGVVGSDVYDKLLLLEALRPSFPEAVFFTTDLDVRLLQPAEYPSTRNLLIASHFGLRLRDELQGKIAPFRSGYNTSSYLGVLRAVHYKPGLAPKEDVTTADLFPGGKPVQTLANQRNESLPVHCYEVGRSGGYELTLFGPERDPVSPENPRRDWAAHVPGLLYVLAGLLLVGALLYPLSRRWQGFLRACAAWVARPFVGRKGAAAAPPGPGRFTAVLLAAVVLGALLLVPMAVSHFTDGNEPVEVFEGISVWPTVAIRFVGSALCVCYVAVALEDLRKRNAKIRADFALADTGGPATESRGKGLGPSWASWLRGSWEGWGWNPTGPDVAAAWRQFERHGRERHRFGRCLLLFAFYALLFGILWLYFDHTMLQARGWLARWINGAVMILAGATLVGLLGFVIDCSLLCHRLVNYLARHGTTWPDGLLARKAAERGLELSAAGGDAEEAVRQWVLISFLQEVTEVVAHVIYYPFIVLVVLLVAQNRLFDDWHWNYPTTLIAALSAGTALACALQLQRSARRAKARALEVVGKILLRHAGDPKDEALGKIERIRQEIEGTDSGAFASFSRNPVVGALLLSLGGGGGLAALEALRSYF